MKTRKGSCLCGARTYEITAEVDGVWICHCSLCRKVTGSNGIAIVIVPRKKFRWLTGADLGEKFELRSSYSIIRCKVCGSPVPAEEDEKNVYLTAGSLDDPLDAGIEKHIFCASKADWDFDSKTVKRYESRSTS